MILEQDADRFPAHLPRQLPFHRFLGEEPHTPPRPTFRRRAAYQGDDALALARVQHPPLARTRFLIQRLLHPSSSQRRAMARTVLEATPTFQATCATVCPWPSWRRIEARRSTRADSHPLFNIPAICFRSFFLSWTCIRW